MTSDPSPEPALPMSQKLLYGLGYLPDTISTNLLGVLALMIYNVELMVPATWIGLAMAIPRLWEAITDPIIGSLSDRTRTRWGRRRPFMLLGSIGCGLLCMFLWNPPSAWCQGAHHYQLVGFFAVVSLLFLTCYAAYSVPFLALGLEMTTCDRERTSLMSYRTAADQFARMAILAFLPVLVTNEWLGSTPVASVGVLGILLGVLIMGLGIAAAVFSRERATVTAAPEALDLMTGFTALFGNRALLMVVGIIIFVLLGFILSVSLTYYLNLAVVFPGGGLEQKQLATKVTGVAQSVSAFAGLLFCFVVPALSARLGRRRLLIVALTTLLAVFLASPLLFAPDRPLWLHLLTQTAFQAILAMTLSCVWILTLPMLADVCDHDQIVNGTRREGLFTALFQWGGKLAGALIMVLSGLMIDASQFQPDLAVQSPATITYLRWAFALTPLPFLLAAIVCTVRFPLSPERNAHLRLTRNATAENTA